MRVQIVNPGQYWTRNKAGRVYTVVEHPNFRYNHKYIVLIKGEEISMRIKDEECRVVDKSYPRTYRDYVEMKFNEKEQKREEEKMWNKLADMVEQESRNISVGEYEEALRW